MNPIVARFQDGRVLKGFTSDFLEAFERDPGPSPAAITVPGYLPRRGTLGVSRRSWFSSLTAKGKPMSQAGTPLGTTQGYDKSRPGFFVVPADPATNNERCFIVAAATSEVSFLP